jgi:hypothetical protein
MGMRRDFILSEEEKQRRKQRIEENRQLSQSSSSMDYYSPSINNYVSESIDEIDRVNLINKRYFSFLNLFYLAFNGYR